MSVQCCYVLKEGNMNEYSPKNYFNKIKTHPLSKMLQKESSTNRASWEETQI